MAWSKKTKTIIWISVGAVLLIILIIVLFSGKSKAQTPPKQLPHSPPADKAGDKKTADRTSNQVIKEVFPLKHGKSGKEVEQAQIFLLKEYGAKFPKFGIDGVWRDETEKNMVNFLKKNSISKDYYIKTGMNKIKTSTFK